MMAVVGNNAEGQEGRNLKGLVAAPFTPFHPDGSVNLGIIAELADALVDNGVTGAFVCGTTGEGVSLTVAERQAVAAQWVKVADGRLQVIVHVGHTCQADACTLARHAEQIGAQAIAAMAPYFFHPADPAALAAFCRGIAAAAPHTPFYYYHIPAMTGVQLSVPAFLQAAGDIPTLAGVKFTSENLMEYSQCRRAENGKYNILFGRDEILLAGLCLGAAGAVGSTYNFAAPVYQRLLKAWAAGDMEVARAEQALAADVVRVFVPYGGVAAQKAIMQMIGLDCGPVRPPLQGLAADQFTRLRAQLEEVGFFARCAMRLARRGSGKVSQAI